MNKRLIRVLCPALAFARVALSQGTFQNLDFEAARVVFVQGQAIATTNALPGWTAYSGADQLSQIDYNLFTVVPPVELYGSNSLVIQGNFSIRLDGGSIAQAGLVPASAHSLLFKGSPSGLPVLLLALDGQNLPYLALFNGPNYTLYGADVSGFAGQTATLAISASRGSGLVIDDIQFSPLAIPEPTFLALTCSAGLAFAVRLRRMTRRRNSGTHFSKTARS
jgi:hypothetical protein